MNSQNRFQNQQAKFERAFEPILVKLAPRFCTNCFALLIGNAFVYYQECYVNHKKRTGMREPIYFPIKGDYNLPIPVSFAPSCLSNPNNTGTATIKILRFYTFIHSKTHSISALNKLVRFYTDKLDSLPDDIQLFEDQPL